MAILRWILLAFSVLFVLGFSIQNQAQQVTILVGTWTSPRIPLFMALFIAFTSGVLVYLLLTLSTQLKLRGELSRHRRECSRLKSELNRLRNLNLDKEVDTLFTTRQMPSTYTLSDSKPLAGSGDYEVWGA